MVKIAIVNSSSFGKHFPKHLSELKGLGDVEYFRYDTSVYSEQLVEDLQEFEYIISSVTPNFDRFFFENTPKLKLISRHGIGYNNIDVEAATDYGVYVSKVDAEIEQDAVAENAVALLMSLSRNIINSSKAVLEDQWDRRAEFMGFQFRNKVLGIIGIGNIGSRVAQIFRDGFNMSVLAYDPFLSEDKKSKDIYRNVKFVSLDELLEKSDFISLNAFLDEKSFHILNETNLSKVKNNVLIVNTARGELVNDRAILEAIQKGTIAGYATDVVENEPIDAQHYLLDDHRIIVTPHISAYTWECLEGMGDKCVDDVIKVFNGEVPNGLVNKEML